MDKKLSYIISELEETKSILKKAGNSDSLSALELDTVKLKFQKMYEVLNQIITSDLKIADTVKPVETRKEVAEDEKPVHKKENDLIEIERPAAEDKNVELPKEELHEIRNKPIHSEHKETIIAEKFSRDQKFINEVIAQGTQKKDFSSIMASKPINSIESAIGINEKFLFIHNLFNGDAETYKKTINILDNSANFNEAFNYLHNTFNWEMKGEAAQRLLELVRRRFIV